MSFLLALALPVLALGGPVAENGAVLETRQQPAINWTAEYTTQCKTCPYDLCTNVAIAGSGDEVALTCWTEGDTVGDTNLWLKWGEQGRNCYLAEYDLTEYGDFRADLNHCGEVPLSITRQDATVRYLSECKWGRGTSSESILYYGRDVDVTLTCWSNGNTIMNDNYWYKTTDNCHVSGSGLWARPDVDDLDWCGPPPGPRINETRRSIEDEDDLSARTSERSVDAEDASSSLHKRWLQPEQIGEEYAPCRSCPTATTNSTCRPQKIYEFNDTVVSQCVTDEFVTYPNGSADNFYWLLTTDWCWVEGSYFWVPPWDNYRFPRCEYWEGY